MVTLAGALEYKVPDRLLPKNLGAMESTGISVFAYPKLVEALGLHPRQPRAYDTFQMLALPDLDVLDAFGCDVVTVNSDSSISTFEDPERWYDYGFNGRLPARVRHSEAFEVQAGHRVWYIPFCWCGVVWSDPALTLPALVYRM